MFEVGTFYGAWNMQRVRSRKILRFTLGMFWCLLHLPVSIVHLGSYLIKLLLYYMISSGLLQKYQNLQLDKLQYLAIVVESEEAKNTTNIKQLLSWLAAIGVKYVTLYDMEGKHVQSFLFNKCHQLFKV